MTAFFVDELRAIDLPHETISAVVAALKRSSLLEDMHSMGWLAATQAIIDELEAENKSGMLMSSTRTLLAIKRVGCRVDTNRAEARGEKE